MKNPAIDRLHKHFAEIEKQMALAKNCLADLDPDFNEKLNRSVDTLNLSARARNCLRNGVGAPYSYDEEVEITLIGELVQLTEAKLLRTPNMGRKSIIEIKEKLAELGLHLGAKP